MAISKIELTEMRTTEAAIRGTEDSPDSACDATVAISCRRKLPANARIAAASATKMNEGDDISAKLRRERFSSRQLGINGGGFVGLLALFVSADCFRVRELCGAAAIPSLHCLYAHDKKVMPAAVAMMPSPSSFFVARRLLGLLAKDFFIPCLSSSMFAHMPAADFSATLALDRVQMPFLRHLSLAGAPQRRCTAGSWSNLRRMYVPRTDRLTKQGTARVPASTRAVPQHR